ENGTITVVLPNGEEYVFEADENGNVDEVFPVALEDNTEITVILADSEGNSVEETLLYSSSPDPEEDEEQPEDGDDSGDGQEDDGSEDGQDGDDSDNGQEDDGSEDGQDGDDSDDGQEDDGSEDGQNGDVPGDGQEDDGYEDGQDGDETGDGQEDDGSEDGQEGDGSEDGQDGDDSGDSQDGETSDDGEATYSYLEDYGSGIVVKSDSSVLLDKTLSVELLPDSELIDLPHDLYNIEDLDEEGNEYELTHPVTVTVPAAASVASVDYFGEDGDCLAEVSYSVADGPVSFESSDFRQYAVAYEEGTYANRAG